MGQEYKLQPYDAVMRSVVSPEFDNRSTMLNYTETCKGNEKKLSRAIACLSKNDSSKYSGYWALCARVRCSTLFPRRLVSRIVRIKSFPESRHIPIHIYVCMPDTVIHTYETRVYQCIPTRYRRSPFRACFSTGSQSGRSTSRNL